MGRLKIEMLGTSFTIQANEDNQYLEKLLGYYQRITDDVKRIDSIKSPLQVAILSGIMICDELYKEKQNKIALENGESVAQISENSMDSDEIQRITLEIIKKIDGNKEYANTTIDSIIQNIFLINARQWHKGFD